MNPTQMEHPTKYIHEHFQKGGDIQNFLLVLFGMAALFVILAIVHRIQRGDRVVTTPNSPMRLFKNTIAELGLTVRQRDFLGRVATEIKLPHPSTMLLSPTLFDRELDRWWKIKGSMSDRAKTNANKMASSVRDTLFDDSSRE